MSNLRFLNDYFNAVFKDGDTFRVTGDYVSPLGRIPSGSKVTVQETDREYSTFVFEGQSWVIPFANLKPIKFFNYGDRVLVTESRNEGNIGRKATYYGDRRQHSSTCEDWKSVPYVVDIDYIGIRTVTNIKRLPPPINITRNDTGESIDLDADKVLDLFN